MKKKLTIIGYNETTVNTFYEQIISLFSDNILVDKFCINDEDIKKGINADLILIPSYNILKIIKPYIQEKSEIIVANRTISKMSLEKIMSIPEGAQAMLLDEREDMAAQMVSIIYQIGVKHIELIPTYLSCNHSEETKYLVVLGELEYHKNQDKEIIILENSLLDISTIIDIGAKLSLIHILQRQNIKKSYKEIVTANFGLSTVMGQANRFEREIDILLQVLDDGIIGVNSRGVVFSCNEGAENIIGCKKHEVIGGHGLKILPDIPFRYVLENLEPVKEKLVKINGYDVVVSVDPIIHSSRLYGAVAIVRKFNDIEKKQHKLREQLVGKGHRAKYGFEDILGESEIIKKCKDIAKRMAKSDSSILITGESGTGKELFAQAIHNSSKRRNYQFVAINCGALPESLLESELFGYEEGAFTGARKGGKPGLFELAHNGTLFLDEIGEMPLNLQMRLLRVLQEREVMRIGGDRLIKVDIRIIGATNRNLKDMVRNGEFREDLYFRLNVLPLKIPPLRTRKSDILLIIDQVKKQFHSSFELTLEVKEALINHIWKGNVRELRNYIEYLANLGIKEISVKDLPFDDEEDLFDDDILNLAEKRIVEQFLKLAHGKLEKYLFVLEELEKSYSNKIRLGRRTLYQISKDKDIFLSEQEIRTILMNLGKFSMVKVYVGRGGSVIMDFGKKVLKYLKTNY